MAEDLRALVFEAPSWGWLGVVASERGLRALFLPRSSPEGVLATLRREYSDVSLVEHDAFLETVAGQVQRYLAGELREFDVPVDLRGHTAFALGVWAATGRIGYGETRAYRWVADQVGGGGAGIYQAVGAALGSNPVPLVVPCHRVVGSDGALHGYAGGLDMKQRLLAMETGQGTLGFH